MQKGKSMLERWIGTNAGIGIFILRLTLGIIFLAHGPDKLFGIFTGGGISGTIEAFNSMGLPFAAVTAWIVAIGETVCGLALVLGLFAREAAIFLIVLMIGAIATVHWENGFFIMNDGFEYNFAIIGMCICILFGGSGYFSLGRFGKSRNKLEFVKDSASVKLEPPENDY
jgi:putative oxidoreductase